MSKLNQPMPLFIRIKHFGTTTTTIHTIVKQKSSIVLIPFAKHLQSLLLKNIKIKALAPLKNISYRSKSKCPHTTAPHNTQTLKYRKRHIVNTLPPQNLVKQITTIPIRQTILKHTKVPIEWLWLSNKNPRTQRQLQRGYRKTIGKPLLVVLKSAKMIIWSKGQHPHPPISILHTQNLYSLNIHTPDPYKPSSYSCSYE